MVVTDTDLEHVVDVQLVDSLQRHVQVGRAQRRRDEELDARGRLQTLQAEGARLEAVDAARAVGAASTAMACMLWKVEPRRRWSFELSLGAAGLRSCW